MKRSSRRIKTHIELHSPNLVRERRRKKRGPWKGILIVLAIILIPLGILFLINIGSLLGAYRNGVAGKNHFLAAQHAITQQEFTKGSEELLAGNESFAKSHEALGKVFLLDDVPVLKTQFSALTSLTVVGQKTAQGLKVVIDQAHEILEPIVGQKQFTVASLSKEQKRQILAGISEATPALREARARITEAGVALEGIPQKGLLGPLKSAVQPLQDAFPSIQHAIDQAEPLSEILPQILGYPEKQRYLFLLENNTELRPAGGFIGTYGILEIADGDLASFVTDNVYNLDKKNIDTLHIDPPEPLAKYNFSTQWFLRDANWSPDFPTSAQEALRFYRLESGSRQTLHGVIAITPTLIEDLLRLTGDITIDGVNFTADTFTATLQDQVSRGFLREGIPESERKEIIGSLGDVLLDRILSLPQARWGTLASTIEENLNEKQLLLYSSDGELEEKILSSNWGGDVQPYIGDYVLVVDANIGSLKSDPAVFRTQEHSVKQEGDKIIATTKMTYRNEGTITWKTTRYRTYTRLYVPEGSVLISAEGVDIRDRDAREGEAEVTEELGKTVFGAFKSIEPGETETLTFTYELPQAVREQVAQHAYTLRVQKQPGTAIYPLNIHLDLGQRIQAQTPLDSAVREGDTALRFTTELNRDREFTVRFK